MSGKEELREELLEKRRTLTPESMVERSKKIFEQFLHNLNVFFYRFDSEPQNAGKKPVIGMYSPIQNEVDISYLVAHFRKLQYPIAYPKVLDDKEFRFFKTTHDSKFVSKKFNIPEPDDALEEVVPDLVVIPGVAFDIEGHRVGFGRGYFDNYLNLNREKLIAIGLAYDFQVVNKIDNAENDEPMDFVVSESELIIPKFITSDRIPEYYYQHKKAIGVKLYSYEDATTNTTVFTRKKLLDRGYCCETGCRHCPYGFRRS